MTRRDVSGKVVIVGAVRTPIGAVNGGLATLQAEPLAALAIKAVLAQTGLEPGLVEYTSFGWVVQDPRAPNLARTAALHAGIPYSSPATTLHENCASGAAAVHDVARRIQAGEISIGVAGGTESMSNIARYLYEGRASGRLYGDLTLEDGLMGSLVDREVGPKGEVMGLMTERLVERWQVSRQLQDEIAFRSHDNALKAWEGGYFADYVVPVEIKKRKEVTVVSRDEGPRKLEMDYFTKVKPYFKPDGGTITSQNSSSINDGAAALLLMNAQRAAALGLKPLAALYAWHNIGVEREYMGEGVFKVIPPLLARAGMTLSEIDYLELNEAFAAVVGGAFRFLPELEPRKVNAWGSGIALGHPVGCTGARQMVDMVHQLKRRDATVGLTSRCVGGGIGSGEVLVRIS